MKTGSTPIFQLIYTSLATRQLTTDELQFLLEQSRSRNSVSGITGLLVYDSAAFLQVLEGERSEVETIFSSIEHDTRHTAVRVLTREQVQAREFHSWSMAWVDISQSNRRNTHAYDLLRLNRDQAKDYLHSFLRSAAL